MKRLRRVVIISVLLAALLAVLFLSILPGEPEYQGKKLSRWLEEVDYLRFGGTGPLDTPVQANRAARYIGTNAIPTLLRLIRAHDSSLEFRLSTLLWRYHIVKTAPRNSADLNFEAVYDFGLLGPAASSAVPSLIRIYHGTTSEDVREAVVDALGGIGSPAVLIVPLLVSATSNLNSRLCFRAIVALSMIRDPSGVNMGTLLRLGRNLSATGIGQAALEAVAFMQDDVDRAVPDLVAIYDDGLNQANVIRCLGIMGSEVRDSVPLKNALPLVLAAMTNADPVQRRYAVFALETIHHRPDLSVPALARALNDPDPDIRSQAASALGNFGPDAKPVIPELIRALANSDANFHQAVISALDTIDPEAAAKAGVQ